MGGADSKRPHAASGGMKNARCSIPGRSRRSQKAPGGSGRLQEAPGGSRNFQKAPVGCGGDGREWATSGSGRWKVLVDMDGVDDEQIAMGSVGGRWVSEWVAGLKNMGVWQASRQAYGQGRQAR